MNSHSSPISTNFEIGDESAEVPSRSTFVRRHRGIAAIVVLGAIPGLLLSARPDAAIAQTGVVTTQTMVGPRTITASGSGVVSAVPDRLYLNVGVDSTAVHVSDALKGNSTSASALIAVLKTKGVEAKDIRNKSDFDQPPVRCCRTSGHVVHSLELGDRDRPKH